MATSGMLFLQLKSRFVSQSSLSSWSPTGRPTSAVGNVTWHRQRLAEGAQHHVQRDTCARMTKQTNPRLHMQVMKHAHTLSQCPHAVFSNTCMLTHYCVLWLSISACLCWIYHHNPSVFACSMEKWKKKNKLEAGEGHWNEREKLPQSSGNETGH